MNGIDLAIQNILAKGFEAKTVFVSELKYDANKQCTYQGYARRGTPTTYAGWIIMKIVLDGDGDPARLLCSNPYALVAMTDYLTVDYADNG